MRSGIRWMGAVTTLTFYPVGDGDGDGYGYGYGYGYGDGDGYGNGYGYGTVNKSLRTRAAIEGEKG